MSPSSSGSESGSTVSEVWAGGGSSPTGPYLPDDLSEWKYTGSEALGGGVFRWPLPVPWAEVGGVNCYVLVRGDRVLLIDPGWSTSESRRVLDGYMREAGLEYADVTAILATHHHNDHITQAFDLRREFGIPILAGRGERRSLESSLPEGDGFAVQSRRLNSFGDPELALEADDHRRNGPESSLPTGLADAWLDDGDTLDIMPSSPVVVGTPGHTSGHVALSIDSGRFVSGDHLLPHITTSSGLERSPEEFPLRSYLESARKLLRGGDARLLPAHGHGLETVHRRAQAVLDHHERRLGELRGLLSGSMTPAELAKSMQWTRRKLHFSELPLLRRVAAMMEIGLHLDELVLRDELSVNVDTLGHRRYRKSDLRLL